MLLTEYKLSNLGTVITGKTPPGSKDESFGGSIFFLTPSDMDGKRTPSKIERTLSELGKQQLQRLIVPKGVAVSCIGSQMGKSCLIKTPFTTNQQINTLIPDESKVDLDFLYYLLSSMREYLFRLGVGAGSTMPILNKGSFENITVSIPELREQKKIAKILSVLDDKIELNNKINETLESLAKAIFKDWFIDFGPTKAKSESKKPFGMDDETASIFPNRFEDSELGPIPKDWKVSTINAIADVNKSVLKKTDLLESIEYIEISSVGNGVLNSSEYFARGNEPSRAKRKIAHGDTILSTVRPERAAYFLAFEPNPNQIVSTGFAVFSAKHNESWAFLHAALTRIEFFEELGRLADGGAYPAISPEVISSQKIVLPPSELIGAFQKISSSLYELKDRLNKENRTLAISRDLLLPKLISGEIDLKEFDV